MLAEGKRKNPGSETKGFISSINSSSQRSSILYLHKFAESQIPHGNVKESMMCLEGHLYTKRYALKEKNPECRESKYLYSIEKHGTHLLFSYGGRHYPSLINMLTTQTSLKRWSGTKSVPLLTRCTEM